MGHTATASAEPTFPAQDLLDSEDLAKPDVRRAYYDQLMIDVVHRQVELDQQERRQNRLSLLISTVVATTVGMTGYLLFG